jgi:hypothetical protein
MRAALTCLSRMLLLVLIAAGMTVPVSAWAAHEAAHGGQNVSANQHHHHDDTTGEVALHDHENGDDRQDSDQGHDHLPGLIAAQADLPATPVAIVAPANAAPLYFVHAGAAVRSIATDRLRRPPRFA